MAPVPNPFRGCDVTSENWANENVRFWGQNSITNMKKKRHSTEQVIQILRKADGEKTVEELCRESNISEQTFYRWRRKYGRMKMADLKRFKELEKEKSQKQNFQIEYHALLPNDDVKY